MAQPLNYSLTKIPHTFETRMSKLLLVLASLSAVFFAACSSSPSDNPWATPDSKPLPVAPAEQQQSSPATATSSDTLFVEDDADIVADAPLPATDSPDEDLLADFPAIRQANLEKALRALNAASSVEELPMPDKGGARITRYNEQVGVIEFITPDTYSVGDRVVLTKENKTALVYVIAVDNGRIVADVAGGVKNAPSLKPADYTVCSIYRSPEELEKIVAAQRKAQNEAIAAARAAARQAAGVAAADDDDDEGDGDEEEEEESDEDDSSDEDEDDDF